MSFARALHRGPLETKVRALWDEYRERPIRKPRHAWRLWKLHREFSLQPPEPASWDWRVPNERAPDCMHCPDNCCRGSRNTVLLRLVDVALFVDRGWTDAMTHEKPVFPEEVLAQKPMLRAMVSSFHWQVFPVLRQRDDGTCHWLSQDGRNQCTIHRDRPWVCRVFPYVLNIDEQAVEWSPRCEWQVPAAPTSPSLRSLRHAVFHNFYTEKICDLILLRVYREELEEMGVTKWLRLSS